LRSASLQLAAATEKHLQAFELFAEDLRMAQGALGSITGAVTPDELLGEIFSRFCIGK
jgi:tRNA modification GTPase